MEFSSTAITHLRYHLWATKAILVQADPLPEEDLRRDLKTSFSSIFGTLVHLYQSDSIWLARLENRPGQTREDYPAPENLAGVQTKWTDAQERLLRFGESLTAADWDRKIAYRTLAGMASESPVWQIILHLVNHGTHHRGQVISMLRQLGYKPTGLDLIGYYRANP